MSSTREQVVTAIQDLIDYRHIVFGNIVNIALKGELHHLDGAVDIGETYEFKMNHFRGLDDINVNRLIKLCEVIDENIFLMMEDNDIDLNEVEFE